MSVDPHGHAVDGPWANDTIAYRYDDLGRMDRREIRDDGGAVNSFVELGFDSLGRTDRIDDLLGVHEVTQFDGDTARPMVVETRAGESGPVVFRRHFGYGPVAEGRRLASIENRNTAGGILSSFGYTYTPAGQIDTWTRNLGGAGISTWTMDYDPVYQLEGVAVTDQNGAETLRYDYGYDAAGNRVRETIGTSAAYAGHDVRNRLLEVGGGGPALVEGTVDEPSVVRVNGETAAVTALPGGAEFLYRKEIDVFEGENTFTVEAEDGNGNVETKTYTVTVGGVRYQLEYDDNGNLLRKTDTVSGKTAVYGWDALDRLVSVQSAEAPAAGDTRVEYGYDGLGRRVSRIRKDWKPANGIWETVDDERFLWCGTSLCQKRSPDGGTVLADYSGSGEVRNPGTSGEQALHYTRDHLGSVREAVDDSGTVRARYDYDPWGRRTNIEGDLDVDFGFTGHRFDAAAGVHLTLFRAYDADLGRWLSPDPIGEAGGLNLYGYVGNSPTNKNDRHGLFAIDDVPDVATGAVVGGIVGGLAGHVFGCDDHRAGSSAAGVAAGAIGGALGSWISSSLGDDKFEEAGLILGTMAGAPLAGAFIGNFLSKVGDFAGGYLGTKASFAIGDALAPCPSEPSEIRDNVREAISIFTGFAAAFSPSDKVDAVIIGGAAGIGGALADGFAGMAGDFSL